MQLLRLVPEGDGPLVACRQIAERLSTSAPVTTGGLRCRRTCVAIGLPKYGLPKSVRAAHGVAQIVKSLVFAVDGEIVVALVSGADQLDEAKLAEAAGGFHCQRVEPDLVRSTTGFPIGGVPPLGFATQLTTFMDESLLNYSEVWAAAGTPRHVFCVNPTELAKVCRALVADIVRR